MRANSFFAGLREYLNIVWYRKWLVVLIVTVVVGTALYYTRLQPVTYVSTARVLVSHLSDSPSGSAPAPLLNLDTESLIALSDKVANIAADKLRVSDTRFLSGGLSVSVEPGSEIISFSYTDTSPSTAQERAQAFADAYLEFRREEASKNLLAVSRAAQVRITALNKRIERVRNEFENSTDESERSVLRAELDSKLGQLGTLKAQAAGSNAQATVGAGYSVRPAQLPVTSSSPSYPKNVGLALLGGIVLAIAFALARDRFDTRVRNRDILERHSDTTVLAEIPRIRGWGRRTLYKLTSTSPPHSVASERYRGLRAGILYAASQRKMKLVLLTSAQPGEGKTCITANLGLMLAEVGKRVIVVDADLRKPRLPFFLNDKWRAKTPDMGVTGGLSSVLSGSMKLSEALVATGVRNLELLPSGPLPSNPAELLSSDETARILKELCKLADFILIDTAPILMATDAMIMAPLVDGVLFIADAARTTTSLIDDARAHLLHVAAPLVGAVLNKARTTGPTSYGGVRSFERFSVRSEAEWLRVPRRAGS